MEEWIWFSTLDTLNAKQKVDLLRQYGSPKKIWNMEKEELGNIPFLKASNKEEIWQKRDMKLLQRYRAYMNKNHIQMINIIDEAYPEELKTIYDPPVTLFVKGNSECLKGNKIAVIGCRNASEYGMRITKKIASGLANNGITVVSGLARGIDAMAHQGALVKKAKTVAVLGSGLDIVYPYENKDLYQEIVKQGGAIISEYIVGTKPMAKNFPRRNRIISGLSHGVLVVEATKKSGTMITVDFALEQGRDVYVVPGNIDSFKSEGTNELLKQGAKLITCVEDILEEL